MCMEDIRLGRKLDTQCKVFVAPASKLIAPANIRRTRLVFTVTGIDTVLLWPSRLSGGTSSQGAVCVTAESPTFVARIEDLGTALCDDLYASTLNGNGDLVVTDCTLMRE